MAETSPFIPGARVAIRDRHGDNYTEARVGKVYKSGNFTLGGSPQQWRPSSPGSYDNGRWRAHETGEGWHKRSLVIWNDATDTEIAEKNAASKRHHRWRRLRDRLAGISLNDVTDAMLDQLEAAIKPSEAPSAEASKPR